MRVVTCDVTAGSRDPLVDHLLADLAEALGVYARAYGSGEPPELVRSDGEKDLGCDVAVLGLAAGRAAREAAVPAGARVYAVVTAPSPDGAEARTLLAGLGHTCAARGARWSGALVVGDAAWQLRWSAAPRMGWRRRATSEAVDRLIAAIRAGADFPTETVRPPLARRCRQVLLAACGRAARAR